MLVVLKCQCVRGVTSFCVIDMPKKLGTLEIHETDMGGHEKETDLNLGVNVQYMSNV